MWNLILSFLGGPIVNGLISAYKAKLDAENSTGAQAVQVAQAALTATVQARAQNTEVFLAFLGKWYTALPIVFAVWIVVLYFGKCVVWDNLLGLGSTDVLKGEIQFTYHAIVVYLFGSVSITGAIAAARTWWR